MAAVYKMPTDVKHNTSFSSLLRLIVTCNPEAKQHLNHARKISKLAHEGGYLCYKSPLTLHDCDCWYKLEYFEFIKDKSIDIEMLNTVCDSLDRGKCIHVVEHEQREGHTDCEHTHDCSTTLIHAAAASGNVSAVKFFTNVNIRHMYASSVKGVKPFHLAVLKGQVNILEFWHKDTDNFREAQREFMFGRLEFWNSDSSTGKVSQCIKPLELSRYTRPYIHLLSMSNIADVETVEKIIHIGSLLYPDLHNLLIYLMLNDARDTAAALLATNTWKLNHIIPKQDDAQIEIITCILCDADTLLDALIETTNFTIRSKIDEYNLLDVAKAFGSQKCASVLRSHMESTENVYKLHSPFNFLFSIVGDSFSRCYDALGLLKRCMEQGFDVNYIDEYLGCSPLITALIAGALTFVGPLLELGADINAVYCDMTVIDYALNNIANCRSKSHKDSRYEENTFKEILCHNPLPSNTKNALLSALMYDICHPALYTLQSTKTVEFKATGRFSDDKDVFSNATADRFFAVSIFAVLHELGFTSQESCEDYVQNEINEVISDQAKAVQRRRYTQHEHLIGLYILLENYILDVNSKPRSLKSSCRITIRKAYTGPKLQKYLSGVTLPSSLLQYLVRPYFLRPVVVED